MIFPFFFFLLLKSILHADPVLDKMRFELVPKVVNEYTFWVGDAMNTGEGCV